MKKVIKRLFKIAVVVGLLFVIAVSAVNIYVVSVAKKSMCKTRCRLHNSSGSRT